MSKLSRSVLKGIVKECIIEIMEESFFTQSNSIMQERVARQKQKTVSKSNYKTNQVENTNKQPNRHSYLDNITYSKSDQIKSANPDFEKNVDTIAKNMTTDPIMASIFKDTAMSTLQEQASAESRSPSAPVAGGDRASLTMSRNEPESVFGEEAAAKWATLAFADPVRKF